VDLLGYTAGAVTNTENQPTSTETTPAPAAGEKVEADGPSRPAVVESEGPDIEPGRLDADAVRVVLRLRQAGHEAYLVGGCVRDLLLGLTPKDFDIATSATPNQVKGLFRNCRLIGRRFRLAHIYFKGGKILEVSTFRATPAIAEEPQPSEVAEGDVLSEGAEHIALADQEALDAVEVGAEVPTEVVTDVEDEVAPADVPRPEPDLLIVEDNTFGTAVEDARRRDFTINGLFYDPVAGRAIDHVNGLRDLSIREIRTIGDPEKRTREDPVRILRAVRFAAKLGFDIESRTYAAMEGAVEDLPRCSSPRLLEETFRLIRQGSAEPALKLVHALDALKLLLPPVSAYLGEQDAAGVEQYWRFVSMMDARLTAGAEFDDSMILAALLLPIALDEPEESEPTSPEDEGRPASVAQAIESLLASLVQQARLPRRIAERCRMILLAQRTLAGLRRRRGGLMGFRGHPLFDEALAVFEIWVETTGEHKEALGRWKAGGAPAVSPDAAGPRRRRQRRRRERPRGPDESESGTPQPSQPRKEGGES
jgi:poly(A) polymerase